MPVADLDALASQYGIKPGETDAANLEAKNPEDRAQYLQDLDAQYQRRSAPTSNRELDSQGGNYDNGGNLTLQGQTAIAKTGGNASGYYSGTNTTPVAGQQAPSSTLLDLLKKLSMSAPGAPSAPSSTPTTPTNRYDPKTGAIRSPYEVADAEGRLSQFNALVAALYRPDGSMAEGWQQVNLYDPNTYHFVLGGPPPTTAPGTPPVSTTMPVPKPPALGPTSTGPFSQPAAPSYAGGAFTDPASNFAEQAALSRYGQRVNPPAGSGTALYEGFAKQFASMLQAEPFTEGDEAALRAKSMEQVEQLRRNEIEDKKRQLAQRRISDKSGIYLSEMNRIDDKYDRLRAQSENELLTTAIGERQRRLTQSFSVLASLASSEEGRQDAAMALAMIPLQLQDQAFQRLVSASNMGGDLSGVSNSLMQLLNISTNSRLYNEQQQGAALSALGQYFGQYFI